MNVRVKNYFTLFTLLMAAATLAALARETPASERLPGHDALDYGFRFASAIESDTKDQGKAQTAIVMEFASQGDLDEAVRRAGSIANWRKGTVLADLAGMLAEEDRDEEARRLLTEARRVRESIEGWQTRRIDAHIAQAHAMLGELDRSKSLADEVAESDQRQYSGRAVATTAAGKAARGDFEGAMSYLGQIAGAEDYDVTWWRTTGYVVIAQQTALDPKQRKQALREAMRSADGIDGWKQAEAFLAISKEASRQGDSELALSAMQRSQQILDAVSDRSPSKALVMATVAEGWARIGRREEARKLLRAAEPMIPELLVIDQPGYYAHLARGYVELGDDASAERLYGTALDSAASLENARPRALAIVGICRLMARDRAPLKQKFKRRLDDLFAGLRAPW